MPGRPKGRPAITLATRVTLLRIAGIPVFILLLKYYTLSLEGGEPVEYYRVAALAMFVAVALTDALDGYLARSRNEVTTLGRLLDPLADKALMLSALVMLTRPGLPALHPQVPVWFTLIVISRDVILATGSLVVHHLSGRLHVEPRISGKIATFLQMTTITWVLADAPPRPVPWLAGAAAFFTVAAGQRYVRDGLHQVDLHHRT